MPLFWKYVLFFLALSTNYTFAAFYDCLANIQGIKSDDEALSLVKKAFKD
jgi:hypothetical protein